MKKLILLLVVVLTAFVFSSCNMDFTSLFPWNNEEEYNPVVFLSYDFSGAATAGFTLTDVNISAGKQNTSAERSIHTLSLSVDQANRIATGSMTLPSKGIYKFTVEIRSNSYLIGTGTADINISQKENTVGIFDSGSSSGNSRIPVVLEKTFEMKKKMGISFGLNQYQYISSIPFCLYDSKDFETVMGRQIGEKNFKIETGIIVKGDIASKLQEFANTGYSDEDIFFFHYAGHGGLDNQGNAFLAMSNYPRFKDSSLYVSELKAMLDGINCRKVVIIDACNSEEFTHMVGSRELNQEEYSDVFENAVLDSFFGDASSRAASNYRNSEGYYIMVGCAKNESSWETKEHQNGLFSFYVFDGLGLSGDENPMLGYDGTYDADIDHDGSVTFGEIFDYAYGKVSTRIINGQSGLQHPQAFPLNSKFVIFKY